MFRRRNLAPICRRKGKNSPGAARKRHNEINCSAESRTVRNFPTSALAKRDDLSSFIYSFIFLEAGSQNKKKAKILQANFICQNWRNLYTSIRVAHKIFMWLCAMLAQISGVEYLNILTGLRKIQLDFCCLFYSSRPHTKSRTFLGPSQN